MTVEEYKEFVWIIFTGHLNANVKKHVCVKYLTGQLFRRKSVELETGHPMYV